MKKEKSVLSRAINLLEALTEQFAQTWSNRNRALQSGHGPGRMGGHRLLVGVTTITRCIISLESFAADGIIDSVANERLPSRRSPFGSAQAQEGSPLPIGVHFSTSTSAGVALHTSVPPNTESNGSWPRCRDYLWASLASRCWMVDFVVAAHFASGRQPAPARRSYYLSSGRRGTERRARPVLHPGRGARGDHRDGGQSGLVGSISSTSRGFYGSFTSRQ